MARPRYRPDDATARDRLTQAFWQLLADAPFSKLTVLGVVRASGLNKNTFYYHYNDIDDLARSIVADAFQPDALQRLLARLDAGSADIRDPQLEQSFNRLCLIASDHSTPALQGMLKDALCSTWARVLHFDLDRLSFKQRLSLEFAAGGVTALFAYRARQDPGFTFTDAISSDLRQHVQAILAGIGTHPAPAE